MFMKVKSIDVITGLVFLGLGAFVTVSVIEIDRMLRDMPTVSFSWKTKQCVDVQDWGYKSDDIRPRYTCENLPQKFDHEWVE